MNLLKSINTIHWLIIGVFLVLYSILIIKTIISAIKLRSSFRHIFIKLVLRTLYVSLIILAILAPTFGGVKKEIENNSKDIFIAFDVTESMNCKDLMPSRLEKAKFEVTKLVNSLGNDKVGLILFTSKAYLHCPMTSDYSSFFTFMGTVKTGILKYTFTDLASPLEYAINKFQSGHSSNTKVVLLVSDGEDFGERLNEVGPLLKNEKIALVTLGIGSSEGAKIPHKNGYKKTKNGDDAISYLKTDVMKELAEDAGGMYFEISDKETQTNQLIEYINKLESSTKEITLVELKANKYMYFLFLAFLLIVADVLINVKIMRI